MKILKFECDACRRIFDAEGTKEEWVSSTYGPCYEYRAPCPGCGTPVKERRVKINKNESADTGCGGGICPTSGLPCGAGTCKGD